MNWFEKLIGFFNPRAAFERAQWRSVYDTASNDNRNSAWHPQMRPTDDSMKMERDLAIARTRDLERNTDVAAAIITAMERNVIGQGVHMDSENEKLAASFEAWGSDPRQIELGGRFSFREICRLILRRTIVDGGVIIQKVTPTKREMKRYGLKVPLLLAIREVDELSGIGVGRGLRNGVEYDSWGRPKSFSFRKYDPQMGQYSMEEESVSADNIIFLFKPTRATQYREYPLLASANQRIKDVNELLDAELIKNKVNACFSAAIVRQTPLGVGRDNRGGRNDYSKKTLAPGMIMELAPGETIQTISPPNSSSETESTTKLQTRLAGSGMGLSYEMVSRDMSQSNYSSARQGLLEDKLTFVEWQNWLREHFLNPLLKWFFEATFVDESELEGVEWRFPGWSWIDPLKEAQANVTALDTGQTTLAALAASIGMDWKDIVDQRAAEIEYCKSKGVWEDLNPNVGSNNAAASQTDGGEGSNNGR